MNERRQADAQVAASPDRARRWAARGLIVLCILLVYWPLARFPFYNWDDEKTIWENPRFNPVSPDSIAYYWTHAQQSLYIPVTYTWWAILAAVSPGHHASGNPSLFHAANVLLHAISAILVFSILLRIGISAAGATAGALLFALHPVQVESIAWTSGAKDLLSGMFALAAIRCHQQLDRSDESRRWAWRALTLGLFLLAMLAKPAAVTVPLIILAIDFFLQRARLREALITAAIMLALAVPVAVVAKRVQPAEGVPDVAAPQRLLVAARALAFYARQIVFPHTLLLDYGHSPDQVLSQPSTRMIWLVPVAIVTAAWLTRRRWPWFITGVAAFFFAVLPVLGLLPFEFQAYSTVADHYLYLAMFGVSLIAAGSIARLSRRQMKLVSGVAAVVLIALAMLSHRQVWVWESDQSLFRHTLDAKPTSLAASRTLGYLAARAGDPELAAGYYQQALEAHPKDPITHYNLGNLLLSQNQPRQAVEYYRVAVAQRPRSPVYRNNLGIALALDNRLDEAIDQLRQTVAIAPDYADAHLNLGRALARTGDLDNAQREYQRCLELDPRHAGARRALEQLRQRKREQQAPAS